MLLIRSICLQIFEVFYIRYYFPQRSFTKAADRYYYTWRWEAKQLAAGKCENCWTSQLFDTTKGSFYQYTLIFIYPKIFKV